MIAFYSFLTFILIYLLSKNIRIALFSGIFSIFFLRNLFLNKILLSSIVNNPKLFISDFFNIFIGIFTTFKLILFDNFFTFIFLFVFALVSETILRAGILGKYIPLVLSKIKNKASLEKTIIFTSFALPFDDYLVNLGLKNIFGSIIEFYNISKERFANILVFLTPTIPSIFPLSSWGALYITVLSNIAKDINMSIYSILFGSIPWMFYAIFLISNLFFSTKNESLKEHREFKKKTIPLKNIFYDSIIFFGPFIGIAYEMITKFIFFKKISLGSSSFLEILSKLNFTEVLAIGSLKGSFLMLLFIFYLKFLSVGSFGKIISETINSIQGTVLTLILAWSFSYEFKNVLNINLISEFLSNNIALIVIVPFLFYMFSSVTATFLSSQWASISLFVPFLTVVSDNYIILSFASIVSGALTGANLSPACDTIMISAASSKVEADSVYKNQLKKAIPIIAIGALSFLMAGILINYISKLISWIIVFSIGTMAIKMLNKDK
jgi:Na+/H+ antiporter NhaC